MLTAVSDSSTAGETPALVSSIAAGGTLSRRLRIVAAVVVTLALLPTLFFPLGSDGGLFFVSGEKILEGATYYRDIVDLKPPLIYYLYAGAIGLFGDRDVSIRIVDLLLQLTTCWFIARLVRRSTGDDLWAALSALLYAVLYLALSANSTALPESYVGLLGVPMILLVDRIDTRRALLAGACAGLLFLLKFPLAAMLGAVGLVILVYTEAPLPSRLKMAAGLLLGFAATAALLPLYLLLAGATHDFLLVNEYIRGYMSAGQGSPMQLLRSIIESTVEYFGEYFSITLSLLVGAGIVAGLRLRSPVSPGGARLVRDVTICFLVMLLSTIVEGKITPYRFSRIYPFAAILGALGGIVLYRLTAYREKDRGYRLMVVTVFLLFALLFSPLPRYLKHLWGGVVYATQGSAGFDRLYDQGTAMYTRGELERIGATIARARTEGDRVFVVSSLAGLVYHYVGEVPEFKIYHSAFLIPDFAPSEWKDSTGAFVLRRRPRFIVIQRNDSMPSLTGTGLSGEEAFRRIEGIDAMLGSEYRLVLRTTWFDLHQRETPGMRILNSDSTRIPEGGR